MFQLLSVPSNDFQRVILSREGRHLFVIESDRQGKLYFNEDGLLLTQAPPWQDCAAAAFKYDQLRQTTEVAIATTDLVYRFDLYAREARPFLPVQNATALAYKRDQLFIGTDDGWLFVYQLSDAPVKLREIQIGSSINAIAVSTFDADAVSIYTDNGRLYVVDAGNCEVVEIPFNDDESWQIVAMTYHPNLPYFAAGRRDGQVVVMNVLQGNLLVLPPIVSGLHTLQFSADGVYLFVVGDFYPVKVHLASLLVDEDLATIDAEEVETYNSKKNVAIAETEKGLVIAQGW